MDLVNQFFNTMGSGVILPIFVFIFAVALGVKVKQAFKSAVLIGIALIGIGMVVDFFGARVSPAVNLMVGSSHVTLPFLDVGWGAAAAIAYSTKVGLLVIPVAMIVNFIALLFHLTDTINVDVWNYWHYAFVGGLTFAFTGSLWLGFLAAIILELFSLFLADWMQPSAQQYYHYETISFTTISSIEYIPWAIGINWILDKLGADKVKLNPETFREKLGFFGEPAFLGLMVGILIGLLGFWKQLNTLKGWASVVATTGMGIAAVMYIFPLMPRILMKGLVPISEGVRKSFTQKNIKRKFYFGMDTALCVGEAATLTTALILIPIAIGLTFVLPYNRFLWVVDLVGFPWFVAMMTPVTHGNIFKNVIIGTLYLVLGNWIITKMTPLFTKAAIAANWNMAKGVVGINAGSEGISWIHYVIYHAMKSPIAIILVFVVYGLTIFFFKKHKQAWYRATGYITEKVEEEAK